MIDFDTAIDVIAKNIASIGVEMVSLELAAFRVLAQTVHAGVASPRRDVSAMDGFAVMLAVFCRQLLDRTRQFAYLPALHCRKVPIE